MPQKILAFFASSFLSVALTIPALAEERSGTVAAIDRDSATLTLEDGSTFELPAEFAYEVIEPGMLVHLIYSEDARLS